MIDSGLGWQVDEAYYVDTADEELAEHLGLKSFKTNAGPAIIAGFYSNSGTENCAEFGLISTVKENTYFYGSAGDGGLMTSRYLGTYEVNGVEWHASTVGGIESGAHFATDTPYVSEERQLNETLDKNYQDFTAEDIVTFFFQNVPIQKITGKKIPSVNYVHEYVEGVLKSFPAILGGGGGSLENKITATVTVGGVSSGTTYLEGTSVETILTDLLNPLAYPELTPPSVTLTTADSLVVEKGTTANVTLTAIFDRGSISPAFGTNGYRSGNVISYSLNGGVAQSSNEFTVTVNELIYSFIVNASYAAGEQPKDSKGNDYNEPLAAGNVNSPALEFEYVDAWYGNSTDPTVIEKLALLSKKPKETVISFPHVEDNQAETFDVPADWIVKDIKTFNTFSNKWETCMSTFSSTNVTHENPVGTTVNYTRYFCNLGYGMAARDIKIEWN